MCEMLRFGIDWLGRFWEKPGRSGFCTMPTRTTHCMAEAEGHAQGRAQDFQHLESGEAEENGSEARRKWPGTAEREEIPRRMIFYQSSAETTFEPEEFAMSADPRSPGYHEPVLLRESIE